MNNNQIITFCLLGAPVFSHNSFSQPGEVRPNFVLIIADDVSWDDLGCYGNAQVRTPNIDRIASEGIIFTNFFLTASSSSPSRNSIITGRYPHNTGAAELHTEPPPYMISFPEILRQNGYYTAHAGKFHMGKYAYRGFDMVNENSKLNGDGGEELWLKVIKERPPERPFFLWFASYDAHRPWGPNDLTGAHDTSEIISPYYLAYGEKTRYDLAKYYDEISRLDKYVKIVVDELEKQSVLESTVIIIMADNGRPFPHSKTWVNDRGLKAPFIVHWPAGIALNQNKCKALVSAIDIAPTILDISGIKVPDHIQGCSFSSLLKDTERKFRSHLFGEHNWHDYEAHERMVRTEDFLYILNSRPQFPNMGPADVLSGDAFKEMVIYKDDDNLTPVQSNIFLVPRPEEELYHNSSDPEQFINIASSPVYRDTLLNLNKVLNVWMKETGDNIPENLTKDWYLREAGNVKTKNFSIRGEPVDKRYNATRNNSKGIF